jgi:arylsulfatase A-like enzyme
VKFIEANRDKPFFLYLPHTMVHFPLAASADFAGKSKQGLIGDTIEEIDWSVGQIVNKLDELKLSERTLVIFTSDNGPARRPAPPFRGNKGTTWEGGVREPCLMRWPGKIPAGTECDRIAGNIDVLPTVAKLLGADLPPVTLDGRDISPLMFDPQAKPVRDTQLYFNGASQLAAIRVDNWKLFLGLLPAAAPKNAAKKKLAELARVQLYDLSKDIGESNDVSAEHPEVVAQLKEKAAAMLAEVKKNQRPGGQAAASN